ncbi:magnesium transporter [Bernardetia sp.]|uniref:magnesium transporter n=1 Tax=Bernardetia sp. TaxID=1937974 RepID=UPI0025C1B45C|nr:magnesium transporter [Bernardetia sp.]
MNFTLTQEYLDQFSEAVQNKDNNFITTQTTALHPADISAILDELETDDCHYILGLLPEQVRADIISDLDTDVRADFLKTYQPIEVAEILDYTDSDDAADILNELPIKMREEVIAHVEAPQNVMELLHYDEDCAGGLMAKEFVKANINWTVVECIEEIRRQTENVEKIYSIYVVDDNDKLLGRVGIKKLVLNPRNTKIADIYEPDIIFVYSYQDEEEVASMMQKYDLEAIPVVNVNKKLLGRITVDDILDVITEQAEQNLQTISGISEDVEEDDSVWLLSRARLPWLLIGMVGGMLGAKFIGLFEGQLIAVPAMAFFIPLITATGGNVGIQSSTLVVQALADTGGLQESFWRRLLKSFLVALINGFVIGVCVLGANILLTGGEITLSLVVAFALFCVVIIASIMGTVTPLILNQFKVNPAVASGPFITTANDLLGLAIYFSVAKLLFSLAA